MTSLRRRTVVIFSELPRACRCRQQRRRHYFSNTSGKSSVEGLLRFACLAAKVSHSRASIADAASALFPCIAPQAQQLAPSRPPLGAPSLKLG
jgi:hypothetical protein